MEGRHERGWIKIHIIWKSRKKVLKWQSNIYWTQERKPTQVWLCGCLAQWESAEGPQYKSLVSFQAFYYNLIFRVCFSASTRNLLDTGSQGPDLQRKYTFSQHLPEMPVPSTTQEAPSSSHSAGVWGCSKRSVRQVDAVGTAGHQGLRCDLSRPSQVLQPFTCLDRPNLAVQYRLHVSTDFGFILVLVHTLHILAPTLFLYLILWFLYHIICLCRCHYSYIVPVCIFYYQDHVTLDTV